MLEFFKNTYVKKLIQTKNLTIGNKMMTVRNKSTTIRNDVIVGSSTQTPLEGQ